MMREGKADTIAGKKIGQKIDGKVLTKGRDLCIILFVGTEWIRLQSVI